MRLIKYIHTSGSVRRRPLTRSDYAVQPLLELSTYNLLIASARPVARQGLHFNTTSVKPNKIVSPI